MAHHMYVSGMNRISGSSSPPPRSSSPPNGIKVYTGCSLCGAATFTHVPMLFALSFIVTFVNGD